MFNVGDQIHFRGETLTIVSVVSDVGPLKKTLYTFKEHNEEFRLTHDEVLYNSQPEYSYLWDIHAEEDYFFWHFTSIQ